MHTTYIKPYLTLDEQVKLLTSRGMAVADPAEAERWLLMISYYRLSGYWYPMRRATVPPTPHKVLDDFLPAATFERVLGLYEFDRKLKVLILEGIERVEIMMRVRVGHTLGKRGAFAHKDPMQLDVEFSKVFTDKAGDTASGHQRWLASIQAKQARSKEDFVVHYQAKYGGTLPIWVVSEILDFGDLSHLYEGLRLVDRRSIACCPSLRMQMASSLVLWTGRHENDPARRGERGHPRNRAGFLGVLPGSSACCR